MEMLKVNPYENKLDRNNYSYESDLYFKETVSETNILKFPDF